jgi:hypothetical protein
VFDVQDGVSFDKVLPKQWVILGQELTEINLANREFGHNARSATSRFRLAGSSLPLFSSSSPEYQGVLHEQPHRSG